VLLGASGCGGRDAVGPRGTVGYNVTPPRGWLDITQEIAGKARGPLDVAYASPEPRGLRTIVNVSREPAKAGAPLASLVADGRRELDRLSKGEATFSDTMRADPVDGEPALRYDFTTGGRAVRQVGFRRESGYYVVTLTALPEGFERAKRDLDQVLRSWRWD
jgi:hypothetical protein